MSEKSNTRVDDILNDGKKVDNRAKLTPDERYEVCRLIAEYTPPSVIREYMKEYYGKTLVISTINHYRTSKRWQGVIQSHRSYFLNNLKSIPMSHKAVRLSRLESLFAMAVNSGDIKTAATIVKQSQQEMEGIKIELGDQSFSPTVGMTEQEVESLLNEAQKNGIPVGFSFVKEGHNAVN